MNNNLKNLNIQPDDSVWQKVSATIRRKVIVRRVTWAVATATVVGVMVVAFLPHSQPQSDPVAMLTPTTTTVVEEPVVPTNPTPSAQPIAEEVTTSDSPTQAMQLNISTELVTVEEVESSKPTAPLAPKAQSDEANVAIIGGADGPTAILVEEPSQPEIPTTPALEPPTVEQPPIATETSVAEATTAPEPKSSPLPITKESIIWVPNIIIPNGDVEENRYFRVRANEQLSDFRLHIYDRAGRQVFQSNDINLSWDGTKDGTLLPQAAYVYIIQYRDRRGVAFTERGTVTIIR